MRCTPFEDFGGFFNFLAEKMCQRLLKHPVCLHHNFVIKNKFDIPIGYSHHCFSPATVHISYGSTRLIDGLLLIWSDHPQPLQKPAAKVYRAHGSE